MMKLGLMLDNEHKALVDLDTGEIYANNKDEIQSFLTKYENNYTLQLI